MRVSEGSERSGPGIRVSFSLNRIQAPLIVHSGQSVLSGRERGLHSGLFIREIVASGRDLGKFIHKKFVLLPDLVAGR